MGGAVKAIVTLSSLGILLQGSTTVPIGPLDGLGRLSLDGCLIAAVIALWRALSEQRKEHAAAMAAKDQRIAEKDGQVYAMSEKVTEVMAMTVETTRALSSLVNESVEIGRKITDYLQREEQRDEIRDERAATREGRH